MKDRAERDQFIEFRAQGISFDKIAKQIHVSKRTLIKWSKECSEKIANLRAIEDEALCEKYRATTRARLETIGKFSKRIAAELTRCDFDEVPTATLANILFRCDKALAEIVHPAVLHDTIPIAQDGISKKATE